MTSDLRVGRRVVKARAVHELDLRAAADAAELAAQQRLAHDRMAAELEAAYESGRQAGYADAAAAGHAAVERAAAALTELAATTRGQQRSEQVELTDAVLQAALDIAGWVVRAELSTGANGLVARLREAADQLVPSASATVRVSAHDVTTVRQWAAGNPGLEVVADAELAPGEARLVSGAGSADLTVATALRRAAQALGLRPDDDEL